MSNKVTNYNSSLPQYIRDFATAQVLANLPYQIQQKIHSNTFKSNSHWPLLETSGKWAMHQVTPLQGNHPGLHGFICVPDNAQSPVKISFRGSFDMASLIRDIDPKGPGYSDFKIEAKNLLNHVFETIKDLPSTELIISGHSLGGIDATYFTLHLLKEHLNTNRFANVTKITLDTLNAPGCNDYLTQKATELFKANYEALKPIEIKANVGITDADWVHEVGYNIFQNLDPRFVDVSLVKIDKIPYESDGTPDMQNDFAINFTEMLIAHGLDDNFFSPNMPFGKIETDVTHQHWNNQDLEGYNGIHNELGQRALLINSLHSLWNGMKSLMFGTEEDYCAIHPTNPKLDVNEVVTMNEQFSLDNWLDNNFGKNSKTSAITINKISENSEHFYHPIEMHVPQTLEHQVPSVAVCVDTI